MISHVGKFLYRNNFCCYVLHNIFHDLLVKFTKNTLTFFNSYDILDISIIFSSFLYSSSTLLDSYIIALYFVNVNNFFTIFRNSYNITIFCFLKGGFTMNNAQILKERVKNRCIEQGKEVTVMLKELSSRFRYAFVTYSSRFRDGTVTTTSQTRGHR